MDRFNPDRTAAAKRAVLNAAQLVAAMFLLTLIVLSMAFTLFLIQLPDQLPEIP